MQQAPVDPLQGGGAEGAASKSDGAIVTDSGADTLGARLASRSGAGIEGDAMQSQAAASSVSDLDEALRGMQAASQDIPDTATDARADRTASDAADQDADPAAQTAQRTQGAAATLDDALEAMANAARAAETATGATGAAPGADAVAARLNEVEAGIARDRVAASLEKGLFAIDAGTDADGAAATLGTAAGAPAVVAPIGANGASEQGAFGQNGAGPAADLARDASDARPTGQIAAKGLGILANQRGGAITMRLEPPALGQLRIELRISQGAVVADFTAATPEARVLLEANLGMLRERLESQGLSVERLSVHGGGRGTESAAVGVSHGGDARPDTSGGSGSDTRDRSDRSGARQDAAGGESRGRRDGGEQGRERNGRGERREPAGFAGVLRSQRSGEEMRRFGKAS